MPKPFYIDAFNHWRASESDDCNNVKTFIYENKEMTVVETKVVERTNGG